MISLCMKKRMYFVILGGVGACLLLMHMMSVAYSSTMIETNRASTSTLSRFNNQSAGPLQPVIPSQEGAQPAQGNTQSPNGSSQPTTSSQGNDQQSAGSQPPKPPQGSDPPPIGPPPLIGQLLPVIPAQGGVQQNSQSFHGISNSANHVLLIGRNEGNTGNQGVNGGFAQDNSIDNGNAVISQHKAIGAQVNNQLIAGDGGGSNSGNSATNIGFNQGNSGNEGINLGHNQDNAGNSGNQVNNQANVIGTQINKQGTTVNNDHNVIEHQINYVHLLPNVGLYLSVRPKLEFAISVGK